MDKETFATLVIKQQRQLYRIAVSYTGSSADAEDAMQEALLRAWNRRNTLRDVAYFSTWLNRILINECKTLLRKRKRHVLQPDLPNISTPPPDEQAALLRAALFSLPEKYRMVLYLHYYQGYTALEMAEMLGKNPSTVRTWLVQARWKLKEILEVEEYGRP